jgi:hypothetical protein
MLMGPQKKAGPAFQKPRWERVRRAWDNLRRMNEGVHAPNVLPATWRQDDPTFDAACQVHDLRVIEATRAQRARERRPGPEPLLPLAPGLRTAAYQ